MAEQTYTVGVMKVSVTGASPDFDALVDAATKQLGELLERESLQLHVRVLEFQGPQLVPSEGVYAPLDFLQIGVTEKVERKINFLMVVTDVDLAATNRSYGLSFPSQLVNVGVVSARRLSPQFQGEEHSLARAERRLTSLLLHTFGHLLNLPASRDPANMMFAFHELSDLEGMRGVTPEQVQLMHRNMPREAHDEMTRTGILAFTVKQLLRNIPSVLRAAFQANPLRLAIVVPAMFTTALSVDLVFFFTAEIWDIASTVELYEMLLFSVATIAVAVWTLYQGFTLSGTGGQQRVVTESMVVARGATLVALTLAVLVFYLLLAALGWFGAVTFFPSKLMETWPTVDPATSTLDHLKLVIFLAAVGALTGVLGAVSSRQELIRRILFVTEARS